MECETLKFLRLKRDGVEKLWLLYLESMELGFQSWSVFLDTNKEWAVDILCTFPVAVFMCAVFGYSLPYKQCVLFSFYCQLHPVHWSFLPFSLITQLDTLIKLPNLFSWSSVFVLINRELHNSQILKTEITQNGKLTQVRHLICLEVCPRKSSMSDPWEANVRNLAVSIYMDYRRRLCARLQSPFAWR